MARISEIHYSDGLAASSGIAEFFEIALSPGEDPADFYVSTYNQDGSVHLDLPLTHPNIQVSLDPDTGEMVYVISSLYFRFRLTDPDSGSSRNNEAVSLTDVSGSSNTVVDFYDWGGGTQNITATDGAAAGATSTNLAGNYGTSIQFNQPDPNTTDYSAPTPGDSGIFCFVSGSLIDTPTGPKLVEDLQVGDSVITLNGAQKLCWVGSKTVDATGEFAPYQVKAGTFGATRDLWLSPAHRVLVTGYEAELMFGTSDVLVPVNALANGKTIRRVPQAKVTYHHIMFESHQIVFSHGVASESFYPGVQAMDALAKQSKTELLKLFPKLQRQPQDYGAAVHTILKGREGKILAHRS